VSIAEDIVSPAAVRQGNLIANAIGIVQVPALLLELSVDLDARCGFVSR
jgi:hypothetical protein